MQTINATLAIATVPMQPWGEVYAEDAALRKGTVFPALNMPFYVTEDILDSPVTAKAPGQPGNKEQQEREALMTKIDQVSFFLNDLTLYLDTHCEDSEALRLFAEKGQERSRLLTLFAEQFYPLTQDCIAKCKGAAEEYLWAKGPMPWEGACV